jgi:hypothetical protein
MILTTIHNSVGGSTLLEFPTLVLMLGLPLAPAWSRMALFRNAARATVR